ncbi:MAG: hypothetical protein M3173_02165, partial [Chloroflexota bacterium]|nr:hypothetical protein [Chloroflexota bacterium]
IQVWVFPFECPDLALCDPRKSDTELMVLWIGSSLAGAVPGSVCFHLSKPGYPVWRLALLAVVLSHVWTLIVLGVGIPGFVAGVVFWITGPTVWTLLHDSVRAAH